MFEAESSLGWPVIKKNLNIQQVLIRDFEIDIKNLFHSLRKVMAIKNSEDLSEEKKTWLIILMNGLPHLKNMLQKQLKVIELDEKGVYDFLNSEEEGLLFKRGGNGKTQIA